MIIKKSKEKCLVLGTGGHARVVLSILFEKMYQHIYDTEGLIDLVSVRENENILGVPVIGSVEDMHDYLNVGIRTLFLAIGDNTTRKKYFEFGKAIGFNMPNLISKFAYIAASSNMGSGNVICPHAHLGPKVIIGENNLINTHAILEHESSLGSHSHLSTGSIVCGRSHLDDLVMLGASGTIIDSIKIAAGTFIGAGGVVTEDIIHPSGLYLGVPARRVAER